MVPVFPLTEAFTAPPLHIVDAEVKVTVPDTDVGFTVIVTAGVEVKVPQGEFTARTKTCLVIADEEVFVNVWLNEVLLLVTESVFQVAPLSVEYS